MKAVIANEEHILIERNPTTAAPVLKTLTVAFIVCYLSILFSGISSMLMSVYLPVVVKDLLGSVSEEKINNVSAYINSVFIFGSTFGGFAWGFICDKIGRSKAVFCSTAVYGLFTVLTAFSSSWVLAGVYRFITGFGAGGVIVTTNILIAEIWPEKRRAIAIGIVSAAMPVGFIVAGAINNLAGDWHQAFLTGLIPVATALISIFILPESPKWKSNKEGLVSKPVSRGLFATTYKKNLVTGSLIFGSMLIGLWAVFSWAPTWVQSITANDAAAKDLRGSTMMVLSITGLVGSIISGWIVNAIGLRKTLIMCFAGCFVMTFVVFKLNTSVTTATFVEMSLLAIFFGISQGTLAVYIPHLF